MGRMSTDFNYLNHAIVGRNKKLAYNPFFGAQKGRIPKGYAQILQSKLFPNAI
jgi:hypothetical protein